MVVVIANGVLLAGSAVIGTDVVASIGGLLVPTEVVGVEQPQEVEVDDTPAIRSCWAVVMWLKALKMKNN